MYGWRVEGGGLISQQKKKKYKISRNNVSANFILTNFAIIY